jgi:hypothetical protein
MSSVYTLSSLPSSLSSPPIKATPSGKKEWEIGYNELKIEEKIGEGSFGVVYKVSEEKKKIK